MGDFNSKVGNIIQGNSDKITKGGKILLKIIQKYNMTIINTMKITKGTWTRTMTRLYKDEKAILDYIIINKSDEDCVLKFTIDENKTLAPYRIIKENGQIKTVYSDHNVLECSINWNK